MRSKRIVRTRYYCGFCESAGRLKGFWTKPKAERHERGCTANPDRVCGLCTEVAELIGGKSEQRPISELVAVLSEDKPEWGFKELRLLANNCPACILAALRQTPIRKEMNTQEWWEWMGQFNFDFKRELESFWQEHNNAVYESQIHF